MKKTPFKKPQRVRDMEKALKLAALKAVEEHRRTDNPLIVWRNGRVQKIAPNRI